MRRQPSPYSEEGSTSAVPALRYPEEVLNVTAGLPLAAAITAGGQSRRFGQDKALYRIGERSMLELVASSLELCSPRVLIAPPGRYALPGWETESDQRPGQGPLAGLEAALGWLLRQQPAGGWLAFTAVDLPHLTPAYWQHLAACRQADSLAVVGSDAQGWEQPLAALYHTSALPQVKALLEREERRMSTLLEQLLRTRVEWAQVASFHPDVYLNLNTRPDAP